MSKCSFLNQEKNWKDAEAHSWPHSGKLNYLLALRHVPSARALLANHLDYR